MMAILELVYTSKNTVAIMSGMGPFQLRSSNVKITHKECRELVLVTHTLRENVLNVSHRTTRMDPSHKIHDSILLIEIAWTAANL